MSGPEVTFGPFRFSLARRLLLHGETPVRIGSRAAAILGALLEAPGELVSRSVLYDRAWPGRIVTEANLKVQISGLRKALREYGDLIRAEASFGYRFVGEASVYRAPKRRCRAPGATSRPIGRGAVIGNIRELLQNKRLVTVLGPGGIGKTTVALAVASELETAYADGVCLVELDRITDGSQVYAAVTGALDLPVHVAASLDQVLLALHGRHLLLVLDSCEHVTENVALLVEAVLSDTSDVHILVTTRETMRIEGELVWRLDPLETPPSSVLVTAENLQDYSSAQLFTRTVRQRLPGFEVDDTVAAAIAEICRHLDGMPLAIELAASMVDVLGVDEVRRGLDERFSLLWVDRRTAIPRHRSLAATIDWSYNLLPERERVVLGRLSIFAGPFTLDAAIAVASDDDLDMASVRETVAALAGKSFLSLDHRATLLEYRLLETTRAYASRASGAAGDRQGVHERHALYFLDVLERRDWDACDSVADSAQLRGYIDEVRVALDWAFSVNPGLGIALVLAAERLWLEFTSLARGVPHLELALRFADSSPDVGPVVRSRVLVALAAAQVYVPGLEGASLYEHAWRAAQIARNDLLEMRALYGIIQNMLLTRRPASPYIDAFAAVCRRSNDAVMSRLLLRWSAFQAFEASDMKLAHQKFEAFLDDRTVIPRRVSLYFGGIDSIISCKVGLGLAKFYLGYSDQARSLLASTVSQAESQGHVTTLYFVLAQGAIWAHLASGDFQRVRLYLRKLEAVSSLYRPWRVLVDVFQALLIREEARDLEAAERSLTRSLQDGFILKTGTLHPILWVELAETRRLLGDLDGAEAAAKQAMTQCLGDRDGRFIGRYNPVLARILMARNRPGDLDAARNLFVGTIELMRSQGIYFHECDASVGLAELELVAGRPAVAHAVLGELLGRLGDREHVPGLARAREILDETRGEAIARRQIARLS
ncbi:ATP-binding protein [Bradyrhizobium japonicum]|uniref:ATP-binding protein n=1 Tax=Bradyrhizobium japonicum TaxID=375 RepID=UPI002714878B|nr:winged helix-turn-helix domain-containing protein [Bradyrhizobium japonicum]WLB58943.1 winged helix-turn-helix domain-containing protein [Bradyrhizobium japonicum]WLB67968.1 winged helix-turn-helix domain-containing protein [Bradyrhizobium japonicum]